MRILRNYVLKEILGPLILSLAVITFAFVIGNIVKLADFVINKGVELIYVGRLFVYLIPRLLSFAVPMSALTSVLLAFGRLSSDNEIIAMRANGINLYKISMPAIIIGLLLSVMSIPLNDKIVPAAHYRARILLKEVGLRHPAAYLEAGTFIKGFKDYILFIYDIKFDKNKTFFKNVRIYQPQKNGPTRTIIAKRGELVSLADKNTIKLKLMDGTSDEPNPMNPSHFYKLNFRTYYLTLTLDDSTMREHGKKNKEMTFDELLANAEKLKKKGIDPQPLIRRLHKRIASSFASFAFVLIGIPLAITTRRSEKSIGIGLAFVLATAYWLLLAFGQILATKNIIPIWLAMWFANIILISIGVILMHITVRK
ncbi:MAG: LptF/LptG family permease [Candidatus Omnitrophica bacterium]|nr:LptF/LptG family permease [Candidatus Omnitrophota bacterium]